jgi:hypothetical protein
MILDGEKEPRPQLVQFDVDLKKNRHLVALANSITLTPGTITVDLHDNHFTVHALDASFVDGLDDGVFVQQLMDMEKKHMAQDAVKAAAEELTEWSLKRIDEIHDETVSRKVAGKKKGTATAQATEEAKPAARKASKPAPEAKKAPAHRKSSPARQAPESKPAAPRKQTRQPAEEPKPAARQAAPVEEPDVEEPKRKAQDSKKGLTISVPKQAKSRRTVRKRG